jgi:hypothetical protein
MCRAASDCTWQCKGVVTVTLPCTNVKGLVGGLSARLQLHCYAMPCTCPYQLAMMAWTAQDITDATCTQVQEAAEQQLPAP